MMKQIKINPTLTKRRLNMMISKRGGEVRIERWFKLCNILSKNSSTINISLMMLKVKWTGRKMIITAITAATIYLKQTCNYKNRKLLIKKSPLTLVYTTTNLLLPQFSPRSTRDTSGEDSNCNQRKNE